MSRIVDCYALLHLLGCRDRGYVTVKDFKGIIIDKELVKKAVATDCDYLKKKEEEINADKEYLDSIITSLKYQKKYNNDRDYDEIDSLFRELKYINKGYIIEERCKFLTKELYEEVLQLDNSTLGNIRSKKLAKLIMEHPLYEVHVIINTPRQDARYFHMCSTLSSMDDVKKQISELVEYVKENGYPTKTYKELLREEKICSNR